MEGIAGIAKTQLGNLVSPSMQDELTSVSTLDPIKVYINVSEREYLESKESRAKISDTSLQLILADGSKVAGRTPFNTPWRTIQLADRVTDLAPSLRPTPE